jgi:hypothetical protein
VYVFPHLNQQLDIFGVFDVVYILYYAVYMKVRLTTFSYYTVQRDKKVASKGKEIYCQCEINYGQGVCWTSHLGSYFQCNIRE